MPSKNTGITENEWLAELDKWSKPQEDTVPQGWFSIYELAKLKNISTPRMREIVRKMGNLVERRKFRVAIGSYGIRSTPFYKLKK